MTSRGIWVLTADGANASVVDPATGRVTVYPLGHRCQQLDVVAVSDIFGGNSFLPVIFFPATLLAGQSVLGKAHSSDVLLAALGILLTTVYIAGLVFRPNRQYFRLGPDSIAVLILDALGIGALITLGKQASGRPG